MIPSSKWQRPFAYPWRRPAWAAMAAVSGLVAGYLYLQTIAPGPGSGDGDFTAVTVGHQEQAEAHGAGQVRSADNQPEAPAEPIISGAVFDNRGDLLPPGILIAAELAGTPGDAPPSTGSRSDVRRTATDPHGRFTFRDVVAGGEYLLSVEGGGDFHGASQTVRAGMVSAELRVQSIRSVPDYANILDQDDGEARGTEVHVRGGYGVPLSDGSGAYVITIEPIRVGRPSALEFQHLDYRLQRRRVPPAMASEWVTDFPEGAFLGVGRVSSRGNQAAVRDDAMAMETE